MTIGTLGRNRYGTVRAVVEAQIGMAEATADQGLVTWFGVRVVADFGETDDAMIARARVARVHVGAALDAGEPLRDVLDADSSELAALYPVFFSDEGLRDEFAQGAGGDLLYIAAVVESGWEGRNIEHALVRRICDSLGQGCDVVVIPCPDMEWAAPWQRMGFSMSGRGGRYAHLDLAVRQARVVPEQHFTRYRIVANPPPGSDQH